MLNRSPYPAKKRPACEVIPSPPTTTEDIMRDNNNNNLKRNRIMPTVAWADDDLPSPTRPGSYYRRAPTPARPRRNTSAKKRSQDEIASSSSLPDMDVLNLSDNDEDDEFLGLAGTMKRLRMDDCSSSYLFINKLLHDLAIERQCRERRKERQLEEEEECVVPENDL